MRLTRTNHVRRAICLIAIVVAVVVTAVPLFATGSGESGGTQQQQMSSSSGMYGEAPSLAARVASGELPPVEERLPDEPVVAEMIEGVGKYGGQLRTFNADFVPRGMWTNALFTVPRDGLGSGPNIAAGYEVAADDKSMTIFLRPGLKWSDGEEFTAEDIRFMFDDIHNYEGGGVLASWTGGGTVDATEVIDPYTIKLIIPGGVGSYPLILASWFGSQTNAFMPAHYLKPYHLKYNEDAPAMAEEEGFDNWTQMIREHYFWSTPPLDVNRPQVTAWIPETANSQSERYVRNPYYWKVDSAGNQLPYMDSVIVQTVSPEVYQLRVSNGDADVAWSALSVDNLALYNSNAQVGNYTVYMHPGATGSAVKLQLASTFDDPVLGPLYSNLKFRQAISVAIDRDDVNRAVYRSLGVPRQFAPVSSASFYKPEWGEYYAQYDPALANRLLDEVGLSARDADGYRKRSDGQTLSIVIEYSVDNYTPVLELVREYWEDVGLKTTIRVGDGGLIEERMFANQLFAFVHPNPDIPRATERESYLNSWTWEVNARSWFLYLQAKELYLTDQLGPGEALPPDWFFTEVPASVAAEFPGSEPPDDYKQFETDQILWNQTEMGTPEYTRLARKVFDYYVFNLKAIGIVGELPNVVVFSNRLGNRVPVGWINGLPIGQPYLVDWMDQLYVK